MRGVANVQTCTVALHAVGFKRMLQPILSFHMRLALAVLAINVMSHIVPYCMAMMHSMQLRHLRSAKVFAIIALYCQGCCW